MKNNITFYLLLISFFIVAPFFGQIIINTSNTPAQLVQNYLVGGGVVVSNVTFQGVNNLNGNSQIGYFSNGASTALGMDAGIVLASGYVHHIPNAAVNLISDDTGSNGITEINNISGGTSYDGALLEFDFTPLETPLVFKYVFASEEYPDYVCSSWNDAFGFFVTGPKPGGGSYNNVNIALIPSTTTPVSINSVNNGAVGSFGNSSQCVSLTNTQYFVNNINSYNQPIFNGLTTQLTAQIDVIPCQTYHIKIAVADVGDRILDSGVFLKKNSLGTDAISIQIIYPNGGPPAVEGCNNAVILATMANTSSTPTTVSWTISGTATNGVDCNTIPTSITIPAGQTSASINVTPSLDGITEGVEYLVLTRTDQCGNVRKDTIYFADYTPLNVDAGQDINVCYSGLPVTLNATVSGGVQPYSYQWSNGMGNTQSISVYPSNTTTYTVTVTDACGKTATDNVVVNIVPDPTSYFTVTTPYCGGDTVVVTYTGNAPSNATYNWNFGGATIVGGGTGQGPHYLTWNSGGYYTISLTVSLNGCTSFVSSNSVQYPSPLVVNVNGTNISCYGNNNGTATVGASGGQPPYSFYWQPPISQYSQTVTSLAAGTYSVLVSDDNGCTKTATVTITQPPQIVVTTNKSDATCGQNNGSASVTASGGTGNLTYLWSNGQTTSSINNLAPGTYTVTVKDQNNCQVINTITINSTGTFNISDSVVQISCYGQNNGAIFVNVTGAIPPVQYSWSIGSNSNSITNLSAGNYSVTINDGSSCSAIRNYTITQPTQINVTVSANNITCFGNNNGSASATVSGGTSPYQYLWSPGNQTTSSISGLSAGSYNLTVTDSKGCTKTANVTITQPPQIVVTTNKTDATCGQNNGSASVTASGGTGNLTYSWSNGQTTSSINNLAPGTYTVTVKDQNNCQVTASVNINSSGTFTISDSVVHINCFGQNTGAIFLNLTGAIPPVQYSWSNGANSSSLTNLAAGNYSVTISDGSSCSAIRNYSINQPQDLSVNLSSSNLTCYGSNNGHITTNVSGGTSPYQYLWSSGSQTTSSISGLSAGSYSLTVTDSKGCTKTANVNITQPSQISANITKTDALCGQNNGSASLTASGGTGNLTYSWSNGQNTSSISNLSAGTYTVTIKDENNCQVIDTVVINSYGSVTVIDSIHHASCHGYNDGSIMLQITSGTAPFSFSWSNNSTSQNLTNLAAGTYTVTVSDSYQCSAIFTYTIQEPTTISIGSIDYTNVSCYGLNNGSINSIEITGGTPPYSYTWNTNPPQNTLTLNDLYAGTYTLTVLDANQCSQTTSVTIQQPQAITLTVNANPTTICTGSTAILTVSGAQSYTWSNNLGSNASVTVNPTQTTTYTVTGTDANGCTATASITVYVNPLPSSSFVVSTITCNGNPATVQYTGNSSSNATFSWNWGGGNAIPGSGMGPHQVSFTNSGTYNISLTVTENGCTSQPTTISVTNPPLLSVSAQATDVKCNGGYDGTVSSTINGGTPPYTFAWSNGAATQNLQNVPAGIYTITVTDANGCSKTAGATVNQPTPLVASVSPSQHICVGQPAYLNITASGGTPPYQYFWNSQPSTASTVVYPQTTTTYQASVVDANGCTTDILTTTVYVAPPLNVNLLANTYNVCPGDPVMLTPVIWGGVGPPYVIYNQDGDVVTPPIYIYPMQSGWYTIRAEDACGSWDTARVYINVYPLPPVNILADVLQGCVPLTVQFNEVNPDSGQTYVWNFGDMTNLSLSKNPVHTYTTPGVFDVTITVTSANGCKNTVVYNDMIQVWPQPNAAFVWSPELINEIKPEVQFTNLSTGASSYQWMFGDGDSSSKVHPYHRYPGVGSYQVQLVAVSNKGCTDTAYAIIKVLEQYTFYAPTAFSPDGDRVNDFFYVVAHGIKEEGFYLEVYDRWGEVIWRTEKFHKDEERSDKWDGRAKNGQVVPVGTYTWRCVFRDEIEKLYEKAGAINIIR